MTKSFCSRVQVRVDACLTLQYLVDDFVDSSFLIDSIVDNLKLDPTEHKEKFKGTLALLKDESNWFDPFSSSFEQLKVILPAIVTSKPTEEDSIINLFNHLIRNLKDAFWQFAIDMQVCTLFAIIVIASLYHGNRLSLDPR